MNITGPRTVHFLSTIWIYDMGEKKQSIGWILISDHTNAGAFDTSLEPSIVNEPIRTQRYPTST